MKKILKFVLIIVGIFIAISVVSGIYQGVTGKDLNSKSYSYEVGYDIGFSGTVGRAYVDGLAPNSQEICQLLLQVSQAGIPNDGIEWASINVSEFVEGCLVGTREAHPGAEWVS